MASPDLNIGPNGPVYPTPASRAMVRVAPVAPRPVTDPEASPLDRSGVDLRGILAEPDALVVRSQTPPVALDAGIEQARGAFVRNQPADALTLLDAVWEGARHLETGWYLRGSSLAVLGLPAEADKLAVQALELLPKSLALRFLQSVARLSLGDISGARAALAGMTTGSATSGNAGSLLLQVHEALLVARQGNSPEAERRMFALVADFPDEPAVAWGRSLLRQAIREGSKFFDATPDSTSRFRTPGPSATPVFMRSIGTFEHGVEPAARPASQAEAVPSDPLSTAMRRLGEGILVLPADEIIAEVRTMAGSLSAGAAGAGASSAARTHASRLILAAIIDAVAPGVVARGTGWEAESVAGQWQPSGTPAKGSEPVPDALQSTVRILVTALRDGRLNDADTLLKRAGSMLDAPSLSLLREVARAGRQRGKSCDSGIGADWSDARGMQPAAEGNNTLTPLRLGLSLLPVEDMLHVRAPLSAGVDGSDDAEYVRGWGAAHATSGMNRLAGHGAPSAGLAASIIVIIASVALYTAHPFVALAGVVAAGWLLLRGAAGSRGKSARRGTGR